MRSVVVKSRSAFGCCGCLGLVDGVDGHGEDAAGIEVFGATVDHGLQVGLGHALKHLLAVDGKGDGLIEVHQLMVEINPQFAACGGRVVAVKLHLDAPLLVLLRGDVFHVAHVDVDAVVVDVHLVKGSCLRRALQNLQVVEA